MTSLINEGVTSTYEMKRHLNLVVQDKLFGGVNLQRISIKQFYPRTRTIRNHKRKLCRSMIDQECLVKKIEDW